MSMPRFVPSQLAGILLLVSCLDALSAEPVFAAPAGWLETAPPGMYQCKRGMESQITYADYFKFAMRNQVWPQESIVDSDWTAGGVIWKPSISRTAAVSKKEGKIMVEVRVLVGSGGQVLDRVVVCSNSPQYNSDFLQVIEEFRFRPSRYKGKDLITVVPVVFKL